MRCSISRPSSDDRQRASDCRASRHDLVSSIGARHPARRRTLVPAFPGGAAGFLRRRGARQRGQDLGDRSQAAQCVVALDLGRLQDAGPRLPALRRLWIARRRADEYFGTLINAYLAEGGAALGVRAGAAYVDVGTLNGYRAAIALLAEQSNMGASAKAIQAMGWPAGRPPKTLAESAGIPPALPGGGSDADGTPAIPLNPVQRRA